MNAFSLQRLRRLRRLRRARRLRLQRRGVFLLPATFTVANIFCGFSAVIQASNGNYPLAAILILVAGVLDGLDGRIARMTGSTSEFGLQLDSIADTVSFGVAPAYLMYVWAVEPLARWGWAAAFFYVICAAARLARFNIQHTVSDNRYFIGLPTPPAAAAIATSVLYFERPVNDRQTAIVASVLLLAVSLLMVSTIRYRSFKDLGNRSRRSYLAIIPIAAILLGIMIDPPMMVLVVCGLYLLSGPAGWIWLRLPRAGGSRALAAGASGGAFPSRPSNSPQPPDRADQGRTSGPGRASDGR